MPMTHHNAEKVLLNYEAKIQRAWYTDDHAWLENLAGNLAKISSLKAPWDDTIIAACADAVLVKQRWSIRLAILALRTEATRIAREYVNSIP